MYSLFGYTSQYNVSYLTFAGADLAAGQPLPVAIAATNAQLSCIWGVGFFIYKTFVSALVSIPSLAAAITAENIMVPTDDGEARLTIGRCMQARGCGPACGQCLPWCT